MNDEVAVSSTFIIRCSLPGCRQAGLIFVGLLRRDCVASRNDEASDEWGKHYVAASSSLRDALH
jgi:hypothetical protein